MKPETTAAQEHPFYFSGSDTLVLVRPDADGVTILCSNDRVSDVRKRCFVRELAAEGFIPDECAWGDPSGGIGPRVSWRVDKSWIHLDRDGLARSRRRLALCIAAALAAWLAIMLALLVHPFVTTTPARPTPALRPATATPEPPASRVPPRPPAAAPSSRRLPPA